MPRIALQPAGSAGARQHYRDTVSSPVEQQVLERHFAGPAMLQIRSRLGSMPVATWGLTPGKGDVNARKWARLEEGDIVLFARDKMIFASGEVALKARNAPLAVELWGRDEHGNTWEYLYFLKDVQELAIENSALNAAVGYRPAARVQGFNILSAEQSRQALALLRASVRLASGGAVAEKQGDLSRRPSALTDRDAVLSALREFDQLGREAFLSKYGFGPSRTYVIDWEGREYDSKAILGAAYGAQHGAPLTPSEFSGGEVATAPILRRLGFSVVARSVRPVVDRESVERALELASVSEESAFLEEWGQRASSKFEVVWRGRGYPAKAVLAVAESLYTGDPVRAAGDWRGSEASVAAPLREMGFEVRQVGAETKGDTSSEGSLLREPPPPSSSRESARPSGGKRSATPQDHIRNHEVRTEIGAAGELAVVELEMKRLTEAGRADLAARVLQVSDPEIGGDSAGYDIASFEPDGTPIQIEVKTTVQGAKRTPFFLSAGERRFFLANREAYRLYRLYAFDIARRSGKYYILSTTDLEAMESEPTEFMYRP